MKAVCWRLDEHQAVVYTEDREVVRQLSEIEPFASRKDGGFSPYLDRSGKPFAWQAVFGGGFWSRVVGYLRRHEVAVEDRTVREARPPLARAVRPEAAATKPEKMNTASRAPAVAKPVGAGATGPGGSARSGVRSAPSSSSRGRS